MHLRPRGGRGSPRGPARGGVTEKLSAIHTAASALAPLRPPRPLPFTAPGPPCLGLLFAPGQPAFPLLLSFTSPPPTPTPESRVLQCLRSRTYNLLSVSARNAAGLSGKCVLSIALSVHPMSAAAIPGATTASLCSHLPIGGFQPEFGNGELAHLLSLSRLISCKQKCHL